MTELCHATSWSLFFAPRHRVGEMAPREGAAGDASAVAVAAGRPARSEGDIARATAISGAAAGVVATMAKQPIQRIKWIRQVGARAAGRRFRARP